jgi:acylphosphatase
MAAETKTLQSGGGSRSRVTAMISGRVQGVGYRAFAQRYALDLGLAGYAENLDDGRVEVVAEGRREALEHLLVYLRQGPVHADVRDIETTWAEATGLRGFYAY